MNAILLYLIIVLLSAAIVFLLVKYIKLYKKYSPLINLDKEIDIKNNYLLQQENDIKQLQAAYKEKREIYDNLNSTITLLSDNLDFMDVGLYEPSYNFDCSEDYKDALLQNYEKQKQEIKLDKAITCPINWTVDGSVQKGKVMIKKQCKIMLKAFNGECDANISKVKWNNFERIKARINKSFEDINKLGESHNIKIQRSYLKLKIEELKLSYEYEQKKYEEKEEQRAIREQMREEEKAQKEYEREMVRIAKEQELYNLALEQARKEMEMASAEEKERLRIKIQELEQKNNDLANQQKTISNAQQTKTGDVYIISNIGSFGENIYKIGMTRRDNPQERVDELGDASVPFKFDVHAFIHTENAPQLENELHEKFKNQSVNRVNYRKEFFKVSLDEIEQAVKELRPNLKVEYTKLAEAREYRQTQDIINAENNIELNNKTDNTLPLEI